MQMHVAVALSLWGDVIVNVILWYFYNYYHCKTPKLVSVSNYRLLRYVFSFLSLRLSLKIHLQAKFNKKAKAASLPSVTS